MSLNPNANLPKRGTAAQWTAANPVLAAGEVGFETDMLRTKRGDGSSTWTALPYSSDPSGTAVAMAVAFGG